MSKKYYFDNYQLKAIFECMKHITTYNQKAKKEHNTIFNEKQYSALMELMKKYHL